MIHLIVLIRGVWKLIKNGILFWQAVNWMSALVFHCCISQVSSFLQGKMACNLHLLIDDAINQALWERAFALNTSSDYFRCLIWFGTLGWFKSVNDPLVSESIELCNNS